jgi:transposase
LEQNAAAVGGAGFPEISATLDKLAAEAGQHLADLEQLEQRLTALEEKLVATLKSRQTDEDLFNARRDLDAQLRPYRGKMSAEQLAMLERQYLERRLLERSSLPRLSLFYMR